MSLLRQVPKQLEMADTQGPPMRLQRNKDFRLKANL